MTDEQEPAPGLDAPVAKPNPNTYPDPDADVEPEPTDGQDEPRP